MAGKGNHRRVRLGAAVAVLTVAMTLGVAPVIADGLNQAPAPADPAIAATVAASVAQTRAAGGLPASISAASKKKKKVKKPRRVPSRPVKLTSRVTTDPVVTEEGKGTFVGVSCPAGYKAISGGVISGYINLLVSSSAPNNPLSGKFTPRTWWLTVTNANIDGQGGSLSWKGVVNCLSPVKLR